MYLGDPTLCLSAMQITMKAAVHYDDTNTTEYRVCFLWFWFSFLF